MEMERRDPSPSTPVHLDVNIRGVVIPTWVALTLSGVAILAAVIVLLAVLMFKSATESLIQSQATQTREIRLLDLHVQDIENVLIRNKIANREDFVIRPDTDTTTPKEER